MIFPVYMVLTRTMNTVTKSAAADYEAITTRPAAPHRSVAKSFSMFHITGMTLQKGGSR